MPIQGPGLANLTLGQILYGYLWKKFPCIWKEKKSTASISGFWLYVML